MAFTPRIFSAQPLQAGHVALDTHATRHIQVLRLQPGDPLYLFDGQGGQWRAQVTQMKKNEAQVDLLEKETLYSELPTHVTLAVGVPANDRMDWLVEKATELGARVIQPLMCERSVLRLQGERADKRVAHWRGVAIAAAEQSGREFVPEILPVTALTSWLAAMKEDANPEISAGRALWVLSLNAGGLDAASPTSPAQIAEATPGHTHHVFLSGPEGGLSPFEEQSALAQGFAPLNLGPRTLRAETAPLVALIQAGQGAVGYSINN